MKVTCIIRLTFNLWCTSDTTSLTDNKKYYSSEYFQVNLKNHLRGHFFYSWQWHAHPSSCHDTNVFHWVWNACKIMTWDQCTLSIKLVCDHSNVIMFTLTMTAYLRYLHLDGAYLEYRWSSAYTWTHSSTIYCHQGQRKMQTVGPTPWEHLLVCHKISRSTKFHMNCQDVTIAGSSVCLCLRDFPNICVCDSFSLSVCVCVCLSSYIHVWCEGVCHVNSSFFSAKEEFCNVRHPLLV